MANGTFPTKRVCPVCWSQDITVKKDPYEFECLMCNFNSTIVAPQWMSQEIGPCLGCGKTVCENEPCPCSAKANFEESIRKMTRQINEVGKIHIGTIQKSLQTLSQAELTKLFTKAFSAYQERIAERPTHFHMHPDVFDASIDRPEWMQGAWPEWMQGAWQGEVKWHGVSVVLDEDMPRDEIVFSGLHGKLTLSI